LAFQDRGGNMFGERKKNTRLEAILDRSLEVIETSAPSMAPDPQVQPR
jgi:hypothetical protein